MRIGMVGIGAMGLGVARRLMAAGHSLTVLAHRRREAVDALRAEGALEAASPGALAEGADALVACLPDAPAVAALIETTLPRLAPGAIFLDLSTSKPAQTERLAAQAKAAGVALADAPVTGLPSAAAAGQLVSMVGCAPETWPRVEALAGAYSKAVYRVGGPGAGHRAKLVNNTLTQGTIALLSEALATARAAELDLGAMAAILSGGAARSGILAAVAEAMALEAAGAPNADIERSYRDAIPFATRLSAKDLAYAIEAAGPASGPMLQAAAASIAHAAEATPDAPVSALLGPGERVRSRSE